MITRIAFVTTVSCGAVLALGIWVGIGFALTAGVSEPSYIVVENHNEFEIREYGKMVLATVKVKDDDRVNAGNKGFRILAGYIFGNNKQSEANSSEKLPMTAPVIQTQDSNQKIYSLSFVMPEGRRLSDLPNPVNGEVKLTEIPAQRMAVLRFSGSLPGDIRVQEKTDQLLTLLEKANIHPVQDAVPVLAQYNPPWTIPFMRRNEIMIPVETPEKPAEKTSIKP